MMQKPADELLVAYLDGELDERRREEVEDWLDRDPGLRERVALLGESAALIKAAFDEDLREPLPGRLIAAARGETLAAREAAAADNVVAFRPKAKPLAARWWVAVPAAASVVGLVVGAGAGYWGVGEVTPTAKPPEQQVASIASAATGAWIENIVGYHELVSTGDTKDTTFDLPSKEDAGELTSKVSQRLAQAQALPKVPDLKPWGLAFQGVRWLYVEGKPAAQLFYTTDNKNIGPLTVVVASSKRPDLTPTFEKRDQVNLLYWRRGGRAFAIVAHADKGWLWGLANDIGWQLNAI
jgi:anti-sigma factor RsiW